jgi:adenylate cyclase
MMALELREHVQSLAENWRKRGHVLGFGIGVAGGYATLGSVGFEKRLEYSVVGTVPNLACRLCGEAKAGQILVTQRVLAAVEDQIEANLVGDLSLRGFHRAVPAYEVLRWCNHSNDKGGAEPSLPRISHPCGVRRGSE